MIAPEASGACPHEDIVTELSFVIAERLGTINSIRRERKESEKVKAIRIAICEKMIERTQAARAMVEAYPGLLAALLPFGRMADPTVEDFDRARAAIARALGQSSTAEG